MALLPLAWNAATLEEADMASRTNAERNGCWTAGLDVRRAEATRVEAVREESCLEGAAANAWRSILERAMDAILLAHNGGMQAETEWSVYGEVLSQSVPVVTSSDSYSNRGAETQLDAPNFKETGLGHVRELPGINRSIEL
jgi:hypothetical protein